MKKIEISIIIINLNGKKLLKNLIKSIQAQIFKQFEVILVDNGSSDGSAQMVKILYPETKLIKNKNNLGYPKACNQGAKLAKGKYLFFLNTDMQLEKTCMQELYDFMQANNKVALTGGAVYSGDKKTIDSAEFYPTLTGFFIYSSQLGSAQPYQVFGISAAMMVRKESFKKINGFDPDYFLYSEEADLSIRLRMILFEEIWLVPQAHIYHLGRQTSKTLANDFIIFHVTKSRIYLLLKNFSFPYLLLVLPIHTLILVLIFLSFAFLGKYDQAKAVIKGICWNYQNIKLIRQNRKKTQTQRIISDRLLYKKYLKIFPLKKAVETTLHYLKFW